MINHDLTGMDRDVKKEIQAPLSFIGYNKTQQNRKRIYKEKNLAPLRLQ